MKIRIPEGMRDRIKAAADENNRTMNAEIVSRLQASFDVPQGNDSIVNLTFRPSPPAMESPESTYLTHGLRPLVEQLKQQIDSGNMSPEATLTVKVEPGKAEAAKHSRRKPKP